MVAQSTPGSLPWPQPPSCPILNLNTGLCSPQYHVIFDDYFTTTKFREVNKLPPTWDELFTHSQINVLDGEPEIQAMVKLSSDWDTDQPAHTDHTSSSSAPEGAMTDNTGSTPAP
jgi:hypothetical protein